jgi:hypothetical protein
VNVHAVALLPAIKFVSRTPIEPSPPASTGAHRFCNDNSGSTMTIIAKDRRHLVLWLICIAIGLAAVAAVMQHMAVRHLVRSAEAVTSHHARVLEAAAPGLVDLLQRGRLDAATLEPLRELRRVGAVFGFELYAPDGRRLLTSVELDGAIPGTNSGAVWLRGAHRRLAATVQTLNGLWAASRLAGCAPAWPARQPPSHTAARP